MCIYLWINVIYSLINFYLTYNHLFSPHMTENKTWQASLLWAVIILLLCSNKWITWIAVTDRTKVYSTRDGGCLSCFPNCLPWIYPSSNHVVWWYMTMTFPKKLFCTLTVNVLPLHKHPSMSSATFSENVTHWSWLKIPLASWYPSWFLPLEDLIHSWL